MVTTIASPLTTCCDKVKAVALPVPVNFWNVMSPTFGSMPIYAIFYPAISITVIEEGMREALSLSKS